uniref:Uncharacterized protein n=1 Tax=Anguilla anguilla TaxID=7936 RepID=A0A0E9VD64_ANGAN
MTNIQIGFYIMLVLLSFLFKKQTLRATEMQFRCNWPGREVDRLTA